MDKDAPLPGMTRAEQDLVHHYLRAVDLMGRLNPAHEPGRIPTIAVTHAAQALVSAARELVKALEAMVDRGEKEIYAPTLTRAMLLLDAQRRTERVLIQDKTEGG
ncbi:hypothetical protein [Actinocrispum wychmicini]|nr:hypothetical protein [Actinocrispum wychmicini]